MAYLGNQGGPDPVEILRVFAQLAEQKRRRLTEQAGSLIDTQPTGATVESVGLTPAQQKAKYGKVLAPGTKVNQETIADRQRALMLDAINNMDAPALDALKGSLLSQSVGVPQIVGTAGLTDQGAAANKGAAIKKAIADANLGWVTEGLAALDKMPTEAKANLGAKLAVGATPGELQVSDLNTKVKTETLREGLKILSNPDHALNKVMKGTLGFNAIEAAGGVALELTPLMDKSAEIIFQAGAGRTMEDELNKAEAEWAKTIAERFEGSVTPRAILNWKRWRETGGDPRTRPAGVSQELDQVLSAGTSIGLRAFITDRAEKGDPEAKTILQITQGMERIGDANTLVTYAKLLGTYYGRVQAAAKLGPRPSEPDAAARWDATAKALSDRIPKLDPTFWKGVTQAPTARGGSYNFQGPPEQNNLNTPPGLTQEDMQNIQILMKAVPGLNFQPPGVQPLVKPPGTP